MDEKREKQRFDFLLRMGLVDQKEYLPTRLAFRGDLKRNIYQEWFKQRILNVFEKLTDYILNDDQVYLKLVAMLKNKKQGKQMSKVANKIFEVYFQNGGHACTTVTIKELGDEGTAAYRKAEASGRAGANEHRARSAGLHAKARAVQSAAMRKLSSTRQQAARNKKSSIDL